MGEDKVQFFLYNVFVLLLWLSFQKLLAILMGKSIQEWTNQNLWKIALKKISRDMACLSRPYSFNFFKGCLPQILLGPLLNNLLHISLILQEEWANCLLCRSISNWRLTSLFPSHPNGKDPDNKGSFWIFS